MYHCCKWGDTSQAVIDKAESYNLSLDALFHEHCALEKI